MAIAKLSITTPIPNESNQEEYYTDEEDEEEKKNLTNMNIPDETNQEDFDTEEDKENVSQNFFYHWLQFWKKNITQKKKKIC